MSCAAIHLFICGIVATFSGQVLRVVCCINSTELEAGQEKQGLFAIGFAVLATAIILHPELTKIDSYDNDDSALARMTT